MKIYKGATLNKTTPNLLFLQLVLLLDICSEQLVRFLCFLSNEDAGNTKKHLGNWYLLGNNFPFFWKWHLQF